MANSERRELLAQGQIIQRKAALRAKRRFQGANNHPEPFEHSVNTTRTRRRMATESMRTSNQKGQPSRPSSCAIDIHEICDGIKTVMEGGEQAFKLRRDKYGF
jgi:hypothetical protein